MTSRLRALVVLAHVLGTLATMGHGLVERNPLPCPECAEPAGPVLRDHCEREDCPEQDHHHHPARSPSHDASRCGQCLQHFLAAAAAPATLAWAGDSAPAGTCSGRSLPPAAPASSRPPARAPPLA